MKPRHWFFFISAFLGSQMLAGFCLDWRNELFIRKIGYVLLFPSSFFLALLNKIFGDAFSRQIIQSPASEALAIATFLLINGVFWLLLARFLQHRHSIGKAKESRPPTP
jgi:hypothetical protein